MTFYGAQEELVLLSVFERGPMRYWTMAQVEAFAREHGLRVPEVLLSDAELREDRADPGEA